MSRVFVYGDSHTRALRNAHANRSSTHSQLQFDIHWMYTEKNGVPRGDLAFEDACAISSNLHSNDLLVISLLGTAHNIFGLLNHDIPYIVAAGVEKSIYIDHNRDVLIPNSVICDLFESWCRKNKRVPLLANKSGAKCFHLMTPPPKESNDFIGSKISVYQNRSIANHGVAEPELRIRLWSIEMEVLSRICSEWGIVLVPPPHHSTTERGFLREEFYGTDATHANAAYGELVLQQLENLALAA